jgi:hypothetical protein
VSKNQAYFHRVNRLPAQCEPSAIYFLKGEHEHDMDMYAAGSDPNELLRVMTAKDVLAAIIQRFSSIMQIVVVIPTQKAEISYYKSLYMKRVHIDARSYYWVNNLGKRRLRYGGTAIMYGIRVPSANEMENANW